jgi:hypothetical protein
MRESTGAGHVTQDDPTGSRSWGFKLRTGLEEDAENGVGDTLDGFGTGLLGIALILSVVAGAVVTVTSGFLLSSQQVLWLAGLTLETGEMRAALSPFCCQGNNLVGALGMPPSGEAGMLGA